MSCQDYEEDIALAAGGDLMGPDAERLQRHLHNCAACASVFRDLTAQVQILRSPLGLAIDPDQMASTRHCVLRKVREMTAKKSFLPLHSKAVLWKWRFALLGVPGLVFTSFLILQVATSINPHHEQGKVANSGSTRMSHSPDQELSRQPFSLGSGQSTKNHRTAHPEQNVHSGSQPGSRKSVLMHGPHLIMPPSGVDFQISHLNPPELQNFSVARPEKPDTLVIKMLTSDPNIEIIWLVDRKGD